MANVKQEYSISELAKIIGISHVNVWRRAIDEHWPNIPRAKKHGGNSYHYNGLPDDIKAIIAFQEASIATNSKPKFGQYYIPEWSHKLGLARYQIVSAWRVHCKKENKKKIKKKDATNSFLALCAAGLIVHDAIEIVGAVSLQSLYRWDKTLRDNGDDYYSICDQRGKWAKGGAKGLGQMGKEAEEAFLSIWLTPNKPSITLAHMGMGIQLEKMGLPIPSLASAYRFAKRFENNYHDIVVLKRDGEKALNDKVMPYIKRKVDILNVGDCLFADGHTLNFECIHPETGYPFRPTLIVWFDWKSAMPIGWEIMPTENTVAVASALRMAIVNLGKYPKVVYLDNGKAFKGKYFTATNPDFEALGGLYTRLGISLQLAKPYHAQSKVVERFFRTFNEQCARMVPSYTGRNIDDKPAWRNRNERYHKIKHAQKPFIPTLKEAVQIFKLYVEWYAELPRERGNGQTHQEIFLAGRGPGVDSTELDRHFLWSKKIIPRRAGFHFAKTRYEADCLYGLAQEIVIKWSWADLSKIYLYTTEGAYIGVALPQIEVHPLAKQFGDKHDIAMLADQNRRTANLKKGTMRQARGLDNNFKPLLGPDCLPYTSSHIDHKQYDEIAYNISSEDFYTTDKLHSQAIDGQACLKNEQPLWFENELEKYEWCFETVYKRGLTLSAEDHQFMFNYEESDEYKYLTGGRFRQLKSLYAHQKKDCFEAEKVTEDNHSW